MNPYRILTDVTADLPLAQINELGITVLPMELSVGGQPYLFDPTEEQLSIRAFYQMLREGSPTATSQVTAYTFLHMAEPILQQGEDILYLAFSSGLSGTYQTTSMAAAQIAERYPERKIYVVDSLCASLGLGLLVMLAVEQKRSGMALDDLRDWALATRLHISHWFTVDDLIYLRRGGRVSAAAAAVGMVLHIKPVLHMDDEGHLIPMYKVRGRKRAFQSLIDEMAQSWLPDQNKTVLISHCDCEEEALQLRDMLEMQQGAKVTVVNWVDPVVGSHSGPGTISIFFLASHR